jgi:hypothetical protein
MAAKERDWIFLKVPKRCSHETGILQRDTHAPTDRGRKHKEERLYMCKVLPASCDEIACTHLQYWQAMRRQTVTKGSFRWIDATSTAAAAAAAAAAAWFRLG